MAIFKVTRTDDLLLPLLRLCLFLSIFLYWVLHHLYIFLFVSFFFFLAVTSLEKAKAEAELSSRENNRQQMAINLARSCETQGLTLLVLSQAHRGNTAPSRDKVHPSCRRDGVWKPWPGMMGRSYSSLEWQVKRRAAWDQIASLLLCGWRQPLSKVTLSICSKLLLSFPLQDLLHLSLKQVELATIRRRAREMPALISERSSRGKCLGKVRKSHPKTVERGIH